MGKKEKPQPTKDFQSSLAEAKTPNPVQSKLQEIALNDLDFIGKGDYTKLPKDVFFNLSDPAQRKRQRELSHGAKGQGAFGLAGKSANPTALALAKENIAAHDAEDDAAAYEGGVKDAAGRALSVAGDVSSADQARKLAILGITAGPYQQQLNKPSWFDRLLAGAGVAGQAFAGMQGGGG